MKKILCSLALLASTAPAFAANVGVSISVGEPGFYGQIDIGDYPRPTVIYDQPVVIHRTRVVEQPVYLRVPPGQERRWSHYCGRYNACGRPVYFVRDTWYRDVYAPRYREDHGRHDDRHDRGPDRRPDHGPDRGPGHDHGRGHDR